jgi:hypothetical protein
MKEVERGKKNMLLPCFLLPMCSPTNLKIIPKKFDWMKGQPLGPRRLNQISVIKAIQFHPETDISSKYKIKKSRDQNFSSKENLALLTPRNLVYSPHFLFGCFLFCFVA